MQKPVAFFDIDGTLFRSSLLIELVDRLLDAGVFPKETGEEFAELKRSWQDREGEYESYINAVVKVFRQNLKGVFYGDLADIGREVVAERNKRVYRYTRDLIQDLKAEGYFLVAISQSPKTILDDFCRQYGFDKVYGRIYELGPQDRFTGEVTDEHLISNKANIIARVLEDKSLTSKRSVGVGDTEGDIPLLESVERPICFNPNQRLFDYAKRLDWPVVVERKDVIYEL
ncbi:HAD-IB family hydrolase [Candidatus Kaiserbacteria bacterium CG10_big_fil_rev_8_21_14_0_10_44_10]|uniref:phosphoserine phosphatase n=1 Tax=Candidatus Kaiserbacteria bacterium CG10_big_fil_rev_8_21_14_0_10_44_10 TaxID=1974606 RepID=A0A2H0UHG8_9BACT|nr:MAG: HAD-IB family hydrolase [Candidatus Kaiserbacteria bacterium CG10_big_fil_rev_8_21_14_0_10_44_10]